jgi:Ca2+-binding EF-hand superfamily protein
MLGLLRIIGKFATNDEIEYMKSHIMQKGRANFEEFMTFARKPFRFDISDPLIDKIFEDYQHFDRENKGFITCSDVHKTLTNRGRTLTE